VRPGPWQHAVFGACGAPKKLKAAPPPGEPPRDDVLTRDQGG
jgi:hypothetical protein